METTRSPSSWPIRKCMYDVSVTDFARKRSRPADSNTSSEAISGASDRIGGLLSCQRSAPFAGVKSGAMRNRVCSSCPHQPSSCSEPSASRSQPSIWPCPSTASSTTAPEPSANRGAVARSS